jgi:hypothetical protein
VPAGQRTIAGADIRLADGAIDVRASHSGNRYATSVRARLGLRRLVLGHTVPASAAVERVTLDGERSRYRIRPTNRGLEVLVAAPPSGGHRLVVRAR